MAAYLIATLKITDPGRFQEYAKRVPAVIEQYGGKYLVRGGAVTPLEGTPALDRLVILEFPGPAALQRFYNSEEYAPLIQLRQSASTGNLAMVEGLG